MKITDKYKNKTLLIIGAGMLQTYAIKVARQLGLTACAIDLNPDAPGIPFCNDFIQTSTKDIAGAIRAAKTFQKRHNLHGVMTCGSDVSYTVSHIAKALKLPGIPPVQALRATDKGLMRQTLKKAGVPVPKFKIVMSLKQALNASVETGFPLIIKPVDNMGARGVLRLSSKSDIIKAFPLAIEHSRRKKAILEEFLPGKELSIDTIVYKGTVHLISIADRIISGLPYCIERGHTIPSNCSKQELSKALEMAKKGISALKIRSGPVKFDMRLTKRGAIIGEMTARLSGGFHSQLTEPLSMGTNSIKAVIDLSLGFPLDMNDVTPKFHHGAAERSIYPAPGKVISIKHVRKARKMKNIADIILQINPGDILHPVTSNLGKAAHVIGSGKTRKEAIHNTLKALKTIEIKTKKI